MRFDRVQRMAAILLGLAVLFMAFSLPGAMESQAQGKNAEENGGFPPWVLVTSPDESLYRVVFGPNRPAYHATEVMLVRFRVEEQTEVGWESAEAYIYLLHVGADGRVDLLLPNEDTPPFVNRMSEGIVRFPVPEQAIAGREGIGYLQIVATAFPIAPPSSTTSADRAMQEIVEAIRSMGLTSEQWAASVASYRFRSGPVPFGSEPDPAQVLVDVVEILTRAPSQLRDCPNPTSAPPLATGVEIYFISDSGEEFGPFTPFSLIHLPPGEYTIRVLSEMHEPLEDDLKVERREDEKGNTVPERICVGLKRIRDKIWFVTRAEDERILKVLLSGEPVTLDACPFLTDRTKRHVVRYFWDFGADYADPPQIFGPSCRAKTTFTLPDDYQGPARIPVTLYVDFDEEKDCAKYGAQREEGGDRTCFIERTVTVRRSVPEPGAGPTPPGGPIPPSESSPVMACSSSVGPQLLEARPPGAWRTSYYFDCPVDEMVPPNTYQLNLDYLFRSVPDEESVRLDRFHGIFSVQVRLHLLDGSETEVSVIQVPLICPLNTYDDRCEITVPKEGERYTETRDLLQDDVVKEGVRALIEEGRVQLIRVFVEFRLEVIRDWREGADPIQVEYRGQVKIEE